MLGCKFADSDQKIFPSELRCTPTANEPTLTPGPLGPQLPRDAGALRGAGRERPRSPRTRLGLATRGSELRTSLKGSGAEGSM